MSVFTAQEESIVNQRMTSKLRNGKEVKYVSCLSRKSDRMAKPEELIRQKWICRLTKTYKYPIEKIRVEYPVQMGSTTKSADIVVLDKNDDDSVYAVIEVKKETRKVGKDQLKSYCNATGAQIAVWSNGDEAVVWNRREPNQFSEIPEMPRYDQTLEDIVKQPWTIETLIEKEKEREAGNKALRDLIKDLEDEVLSNAGVDVFEEVFKLVFIKMYDELRAIQYDDELRFRNTNSNSEFSKRMKDLFSAAKKKWPGIFQKDDTIDLQVGHLRICVASLESWKLFNSNLDVVDDAFEYLVTKESKSEKGQYFTPRWVIDMCVKMLDPKEHETVIDPACGSAGFLLHATLHNWKRLLSKQGKPASYLFTAHQKPQPCIDYVTNNVFGIDFDERVVRVARCMNLIAGDGQTNVLRLNSLDWKSWNNPSDAWHDTYGSGWARLRSNMVDPDKREYRYFGFDVCLANPPFAGEVKESKVLSSYVTAVKSDGKPRAKMEREKLFLERCIDMVKPGGRIAIVLPEGTFNNRGSQELREYVMERCRVLAIVSLHGNTFKPHTGIRTAVLFLQKWNGDSDAGPLCMKRDDYGIFYAMQKTKSVSNNGVKIYVQQLSGFVRDQQGHLIVAHDLFNHEGMTEDGIAEVFGRWARDEKLSFVDEGADLAGPIQGSPTTFIGQLVVAREYKRIDPKFFSPEYEVLQHKIKAGSDRVRRIEEFATHNDRGIQPTYVEEGDMRVIASGNILEGYLDYEGFGITSSELVGKTTKALVKNNDILTYTTGANIGRTALYSDKFGGGGGLSPAITSTSFGSRTRIPCMWHSSSTQCWVGRRSTSSSRAQHSQRSTPPTLGRSVFHSCQRTTNLSLLTA